jgi:hypothetical protein
VLNVKVNEIEYSVWEGDPAIVVTFDNGGTEAYSKPGKEWRVDRDVMSKVESRR